MVKSSERLKWEADGMGSALWRAYVDNETSCFMVERMYTKDGYWQGYDVTFSTESNYTLKHKALDRPFTLKDAKAVAQSWWSERMASQEKDESNRCLVADCWRDENTVDAIGK